MNDILERTILTNRLFKALKAARLFKDMWKISVVKQIHNKKRKPVRENVFDLLSDLID